LSTTETSTPTPTGLAAHVKTADEAYATRWCIIIYSYPGAGKTTLAAQAPNSLVLGIDPNGHTVLRKLPSEIKARTRYIALRDFTKVVKFVRMLARDPLLKEIDTIVVDTISELQTVERLTEVKGDVLLDDKWRFNEFIYTVNNLKILTLVNEIMDLGKNVILNCHMKEEKDGERIMIRPALSPALLADVAAQMDGVFFLKLDNNTRRLQLQGTPNILVKSRFTKNKTIENPTFKELLPVLEELMEKRDNND